MRPRAGLLDRDLLGSGGALSRRPSSGAYVLLRDTFTDAQSTLVSGPARPGAGYRNVTGTRFKNVNGALRGGGQPSSPAWGSSKIVYSRDAGGTGFDRVAGRTFAVLFIPEDTITTADLVLGWDTALSTVDPRTVGHQFITESGGSLKAAVNGLKLIIDAGTRNLRPT